MQANAAQPQTSDPFLVPKEFMQQTMPSAGIDAFSQSKECEETFTFLQLCLVSETKTLILPLAMSTCQNAKVRKNSKCCGSK